MFTTDRNKMVSTRMGYYPTIHSLFSMIPRETREHMERVGRYSQIIFEQLSKENPELVEKEFGNRFAKFSEDIFKYHDIGRIYIPFAVLNDIVNIGLHFFLKNVRPYAASCCEA